MGTVAKAELTYEENKGLRITSEFEGHDGVWELMLASMLLETIAVRHGMTLDEASSTIRESISDKKPSHFKITRELIEDGETT